MRGITLNQPSYQYGVKGLCQTGRPHCNLLFGYNAVSRPLQTMADRMHVTFTEVTVTLVTTMLP